MDPNAALAAFANASTTQLPTEAIQSCLDHWDDIQPRCAALLDAFVDGTDCTDATRNTVFITLHLQAEKRDTSAFAPFCRLMRDEAALTDLIGEPYLEFTAPILVSTFDGNAQPLAAIVETPTPGGFDEFGALTVMAYLAKTGQVPEAEMRAHLRRWRTGLQPQGTSLVWDAYAMAIARLGYADLAPEAEALFENGWIDPQVSAVNFFREALHDALAAPDDLSGFTREGVRPFRTVLEELAPPPDSTKPAHGTGWDRDTEQPYINPLRGVGRNDPCPCGSGKKYKKCCLV